MAKGTRPPLTKKRAAWANGREGLFKGNPLNVNHAAVVKYQTKLERLIDEMTREVEREFNALLKKPSAKKLFTQDDVFTTAASRLFDRLRKKFTIVFGDKAAPLSESMGASVDKSSKSMLHNSLEVATGGLSIKTSIKSQKAKEAINASVKQSVSLIKTIPSQYFQKIEGAVMRSVQSGGGDRASIFGEIQSLGVVTKKRAAFIAQDQTRKATSAINAARMKDLSIKQFKWDHSGGGKHPRKLHQQYDGQIFEVDNPPIIDERTGERGFPGQCPNCRCRMTPVISYGNSSDDTT